MANVFPSRDAARERVGVIPQAAALFAMLVTAANVPNTALWPWFMAIPLLGLVALKLTVPSWRTIPSWLRVGGFDLRLGAWTALVSVLAVSVIGLWFAYKTENLSPAITRTPIFAHEPIILVGLGFALLNSVMEEVICRGVLYDGLTAHFGWKLGLVGQAAIFGVLHKNGIPPGVEGMILASLFGLATGFLRRAEGGLLGCVISHIAADFAIFLLVTREIRQIT